MVGGQTGDGRSCCAPRWSRGFGQARKGLVCVGPEGESCLVMFVCLSLCGNYRDGALILLEDFLCLDLAGWTGRTHLVLFHVDDLLASFHISIGIVAISPLCLTVSRPQMVTLGIGNFDTRHAYHHSIGWRFVKSSFRFPGHDESVSTRLPIKATQLGISSFL